MRPRLPIVVFGLAVTALAVTAVSVASVVSDGEQPPSTVAASATEPSQTTGRDASSDDDPGDISGPCDEAEHADDPRCVGVAPAPADRAPAPAAPADDAPAARSGHQVVDAHGAGTVTYTVGDGVLSLVEAAPAAGWSVEVEQAAGAEIEVDFRFGTRRVQVNIEFEDGQVRERVRVRDDADDSEIRFENGVVVRQELGDDLDDDDLVDDHDDRDDNSGPGSSSSGRDHDDVHEDDDRSGTSDDD